MNGLSEGPAKVHLHCQPTCSRKKKKKKRKQGTKKEVIVIKGNLLGDALCQHKWLMRKWQ